ncbi:unnamed protein product [Lampetra planeri]
MGTFDEQGWAPVHHVAHEDDAAALEALLAEPGAAAEQLELETRDGLHSTPLLLAAAGPGRRRCSELLVARGARLDATDVRNRSPVELCALHGGAEALERLLDPPAPATPPILAHRLLVRGIGSDNGDVAEAVSCAVAELLARRDFADRHLEALAREGLAPVLLRVLGTFGGAAACVGSLRVLAAMARHPLGRGLVVATGGFVPLLVGVVGGAGPNPSLRDALEVLREVAGLREHRAALVAAGAVSALAKAAQVVAASNGNKNDDDDDGGLRCAAMAVETLGLIAEGDPSCQRAVGKQRGFLPALCGLLARVPREGPAALALCRAAGAIAAGPAHNQDALVAGGGAAALVRLARAPSRELQLCAIEALRGLVEGNEGARRAALELGAAAPMLQLLRRSRVERVLEATGTALWALAGGDIDRETALATTMGAETLVEFAHSATERLQLLGAWGVSALARGGPGAVGGRPPGVTATPSPLVQALLRLLQTRSHPVLLATLPALRAICLEVGYVPSPVHQLQVLNSPCVDFLLELVGPATAPAPPGPLRTPEVQVEAIWTLASVWLGNPARPAASACVAELVERLLRLLRSAPADEAVRVGAGAALAALAFRSPGTLRQIQRAGGLRSRHLLPALDSRHERNRVGAAFQVVVLARAVVDGKAASLRARGMGVLVDSLCRSRGDKETVELAADCIARLARTHEGVPEALVAVDVVQLLWPLLDGPSGRVRRSAALALGHLSFTHPAVRMILRRCRESPRLAGVLLQHTEQQSALCPALLQAWKHYCALALSSPRNAADPATPSDPSADLFTRAAAQLLSGPLPAPPPRHLAEGAPRSVSQLTLDSLALSPGRATSSPEKGGDEGGMLAVPWARMLLRTVSRDLFLF